MRVVASQLPATAPIKASPYPYMISKCSIDCTGAWSSQLQQQAMCPHLEGLRTRTSSLPAFLSHMTGKMSLYQD